MKIVRIFGEKLFTFHYANQNANELNRLLGLWNDVGYLHQFLKENERDTGSIEKLIEQIIEDANYWDELLLRLSTNENEKLEYFSNHCVIQNTNFKYYPYKKEEKIT